MRFRTPPQGIRRRPVVSDPQAAPYRPKRLDGRLDRRGCLGSLGIFETAPGLIRLHPLMWIWFSSAGFPRMYGFDRRGTVCGQNRIQQWRNPLSSHSSHRNGAESRTPSETSGVLRGHVIRKICNSGGGVVEATWFSAASQSILVGDNYDGGARLVETKCCLADASLST